MSKILSEVGTAELHQRRSVTIDTGPVPRAKVLDQTAFDRYLMEGLITLVQHQAAEYLLLQASRAGVFAKAPDHASVSGMSTDKNKIKSGIFSYGRTLSMVRRRYGNYHAYLVNQVVCHDWDVSDHPDRMRVLIQSLQLIANNRFIAAPLRRMKRKRGGG